MLNKVFIRGNPEYGEHIIKYLCDLGGCNRYKAKGKHNRKFYYINSHDNYIGGFYNIPYGYKEVFIEDVLNSQKNWWW